MKLRTSDFRYIEPLYTLCNVFGILPPHTFGEPPNPASTRFKIYTMFHILVVSGVFIHSNNGRETYLYGNLDVTVRLTDKLANITLSFFTVVVRILLVFYSDKTVKTFFNEAFTISKQSDFFVYANKSFQIQFIAFNLYMGFVILFDAYIWLNSVGWAIFQFYIGRSVLYYLINAIIFLMFQSALLIRDLFASLNLSLETIVKNLICNNSTISSYILAEFKIKSNLTDPNFHCFDIKRIRKYYNSVCGLIDTFNQVFGFLVLSLIIVVISFILNLTDLFLVYAMSSQSKDIQGAQFGIELIILCGVWMVTLLMFAVFLAYSCASAVSEAEKMSSICFEWLNELATLPNSKKEQILKEELMMLAQQATSRRPKFSAAGFFVVDFTLMGFIFGTITSYIIVSVQFINQ